MVRRLSVLIFVAVGLVLALQAADKRATAGEWLYLQTGSDLRVSIETIRAQKGWTPVIVSTGGAEVSAVMDTDGRVLHDWAKGLGKRGIPLFTIDLEKGQVLLGREAHFIRIYEQNAVRTRFAIAEGVVALPLRMDPQGEAGTLLFGGLEIPARASTGPARVTAKGSNRQTALAGQPSISKGRSSVAQLAPSRIKVRGK